MLGREGQQIYFLLTIKVRVETIAEWNKRGKDCYVLYPAVTRRVAGNNSYSVCTVLNFRLLEV
jgi:hypothetical protein